MQVKSKYLPKGDYSHVTIRDNNENEMVMTEADAENLAYKLLAKIAELKREGHARATSEGLVHG